MDNPGTEVEWHNAVVDTAKITDVFDIDVDILAFSSDSQVTTQSWQMRVSIYPKVGIVWYSDDNP
jgi:hypothetical protein